MFARMLTLVKTADSDPKDVLSVWRHRIFATIFLSAIVVATLPYVSNMRIALSSGHFLNASVYSVAYLMAIGVIFVRILPFNIRVAVGLLIFYIVGITSLITIGPAGSGRLWLLTFAVLTTLLLGLRAGLIALVLNVSTLFVLSWAAEGVLSRFSLDIARVPVHWAAMGFSFFFMNAVVTVSLGVLVSVLERKINKELSLSNELKITNKHLQRDIAARESVEKALRKSENRYKTLTQNLQVGIFRYTGGDKSLFLEANPAMLRMFGFKHRKELKDLDITDFFQNRSDRFKFKEKMAQYGYVKNERLALKRRDGTPMMCDISSVAIRGSDGKVKFYDGLIEDITERIQLETQLQQAQKLEAMGTLAGGVAHDLNNILSGVVSYPDLLLMDLDANSPLRKPIKTIQDSGKKAAAIVQDLLTLARRGVTVREVINLNAVIGTYLASPECKKLKTFHPLVDIRTDLDQELLNMMGSSVHISKTIMNLISNAAEAMPNGGQISIQTEAWYLDRPSEQHPDMVPGEYILLSITDTGIGIEPEEVERIFEPFYTKKEMGRSGTGLGMAVVWGSVKDHDGSIQVDSTPGVGTRFKIIFPATRKRIGPDRAKPGIDNYRGTAETILVIDDVPEQREVASKILEALGYSVDAVESGEKAIEYLQSHAVDLVILDMIMRAGELDGLETYRQIIDVHPGQKAIITSGYSETQRVKQAQALGAGKYIRKPYTLEKIGKAVRKELTDQRKAA